MTESAANRIINKTIEIDTLFYDYILDHNNKVRNAIYEQFAYIASFTAKKFVGRGVSYDDLEQVAAMALLKVIERYDISRGVAFTSYAIPSVVGEIKNYFRDSTRTIRISRRNSEAIIKMRKIVDSLVQTLGKMPNAQEIAEAMDVTPEFILELLEVANTMTATSLNAALSDDGLAVDAFVGEEEKGFAGFEDSDFLQKAFARLSDKEKFLIRSRFYEEKTQREVAAEMGVSQMYVSRLEKRTIEKLRIYYKS